MWTATVAGSAATTANCLVIVALVALHPPKCSCSARVPCPATVLSFGFVDGRSAEHAVAERPTSGVDITGTVGARIALLAAHVD